MSKYLLSQLIMSLTKKRKQHLSLIINRFIKSYKQQKFNNKI